MTIDVHAAQPAPVVFDHADLAGLSAREFYRHVGDINTAFIAAEAAYRTAQDNLAVMLTEQVARHVLTAHPKAAMVFVRTAAEFHYDTDGIEVESCEGHNHRLVPFEVIDQDGVVLGGFEHLSPAFYLMERLSPLLGVENQVLDIESREWALDCTDE